MLLLGLLTGGNALCSVLSFGVLQHQLWRKESEASIPCGVRALWKGTACTVNGRQHNAAL